MGKTLAEKILAEHRVDGRLEPGEEIAIRIDQTLTQDATGTMAFLQFEALGVDRVRTEISVSYIDHNTLQTGFENADDHRYLQSAARRFGVHFSRPGNGICHQVHLERFGRPGGTLLGSDSHTPTGGGLGMLAIGAGGLDVAVAMAGGPFHLAMPEILEVRLENALPPFVSAKDVILRVLQEWGVKGGVGRIIEYTGPGVSSLRVPERATIANMGAELGATTSVFPSDGQTRRFLVAQGREEAYRPLAADPDARYAGTLTIDLARLEPLVAVPHSPDAVETVASQAGTPVQQVAIGSCTNSSYLDLMRVASMLRGQTVHPEVSLVIAPGSRQVLRMLSDNGALGHLIGAGARILESACGPCIGMGQAPGSGGRSVRTFNRNFPGRSGTRDAGIYLTSPETAAATALAGVLRDPRELGVPEEIGEPLAFAADDSLILFPDPDAADTPIVRGPNIRELPLRGPMEDRLEKEVLLKGGDNITTDDIMPAGAKVLPLRSNIPEISRYVFSGIDPDFAGRARQKNGGLVVGGHNYGQGSSREHAALAPMYLGVEAVLAKSFARIHRANLVNFGILPLVFRDEADYDGIQPGDILVLEGIHQALRSGDPLRVHNRTRGGEYLLDHGLGTRLAEVLLAGGLLNHTRRAP